MLTKALRLGITETIAILRLANEDEIKKIPKKFMDFLNDNADGEYKFEIDTGVSLENLKIRKETKNILGMIAYNYWCDTSEKKASFEKILKNNQKRYEEVLIDKYGSDVFFKKKANGIQNENDTTLMVEYKENFAKKIYKFLHGLFKRD